MERRERENIINYLMKVRNTKNERLMVMTDEDIEHLYNREYDEQEAYEYM
ncbi:BH0509 family protein [Salisediminibacterium beveridgei]|uniref:Fur-regulated basic protein A n=1 Tax=Salisediminibacterium beveridgei TaxID=632773 RepID=A0A1D7QYZ7_9BACI|nr:BH0509 family protein [Salisediminibacterium beveridgei]AOM84218.1 hypothetical protein BBEV_2893 [Salisediminibacterium beveridgei]